MRCEYALNLPLKTPIKNNISNQFEISSIFASILCPFFHSPVAFQMKGICCFTLCMQIRRSLCSIFCWCCCCYRLLLSFATQIQTPVFNPIIDLVQCFSLSTYNRGSCYFLRVCCLCNFLFSESKLTQHPHIWKRCHQLIPSPPRTHTVKIDYCFAMFYLILFVSLLLLPFVPKEAKRYVFSCESLRNANGTRCVQHSFHYVLPPLNFRHGCDHFVT